MAIVRRTSLVTLVIFLTSLLALFPAPNPPTAHAAPINENENSNEKGFNDTSADAQVLNSIGLNSPVSAAIGQPGDVDWFAFEVENGRTYVVELFDVASGLGDKGLACIGGGYIYNSYGLALMLFDASGNQIAGECDAAGNATGNIHHRAILTAGVAGTIYIRILANVETAIGFYSLRVLPKYDEPGAQWEENFEPNSSRRNAYQIMPGYENALTSDIELRNPIYSTYQPDLDWYRFDAVARRSYVIEVFDVASSLGDKGLACIGGGYIYNSYGLALMLFDASGNQVAGECNASDSNYSAGNTHHSVKFTAPLDGTYFIRVSPNNPDAAGGYSLRVLPKYDEPDADWDSTTFEPNNSIWNSYAIGSGRDHALTSQIEARNPIYSTFYAEQDWYRFDATAGQSYAAELFDVSTGLGETCLRVYNPSGTQIGENCDDNETNQMKFVASVDGPFHIRVTPRNGTASGSYRVQVRQLYCADVTEIGQDDCELLVTLYETLDGPNWPNREGWMETKTPCSWEGVECSGGQVTGLDLSSNHLRGPLPDAISNLNHLRSLQLRGNPNLTGELPAEMTRISDLHTFRFGGTALCEPDSESFQTWLDGVREADRTRLCKNPVINFDKTVSAATARPGDPLTYRLVTSGGGAATEFDLTDTLPAGLTYVEGSMTGGGTYSTGAREISYHGIVSSTQTVTITYQATVDRDVADGTIIANSATATGGERTLEESVSVAVANPKSINTLVLLYYGADNNLALDGVNVLNNAERSADNPNATILMMLDGPSKDDAFLYLVQPDTTPDCPDYANPTCGGTYVLGQNMWEWPDQTADAVTLADFIQGALLAYPNADQVILSIIGHGSGISAEGLTDQPGGGRNKRFDPLAGLLVDENPPFTSLSTRALGDGLRLGLEEAQKAGVSRDRIDGLYLDACLMGMFEVGYEIRDSVDFLLVSPNVKWAVSEYDRHIRAIDGQRNAREILEAWMANEASVLQGNVVSMLQGGAVSVLQAIDPQPYTYAVIDLNQMEALRTALDNLAEALMATLPDSSDHIQEAFNQADFFDSNGDGHIGADQDTYADLSSLVSALAGQFSTSTAVQNAVGGVEQALNQAVVASDTRSGTPWTAPDETWAWGTFGGLGIYAPFAENEWQRRYYTGRHFQAANDGQWDDLLAAYWNEDPPLAPGSGLPLARLALPEAVERPVVGITASVSTTVEGDAPGTLTITRTGDLDAALVVSYTVSGTADSGDDYTALAGSVTITAGNDRATLTIAALDDGEREGDETVVVTLQASDDYTLGAATSATVTIHDSAEPELPVVGITVSVSTTVEGDAPGTLTITRTGDLDAALVVNYAVSGTADSGDDYTALAGSVTITAGSDRATLTIAALDDGEREDDETVVVTLQASDDYTLGAATSATVTIQDPERPLVGITVSVSTTVEGDDAPGTLTITRTGDLDVSLVVNYAVSGSATAGDDYTALPGRVTIMADSNRAILPITALDDAEQEGDETVVVTLQASDDYDLDAVTSATVTIHDGAQPTSTYTTYLPLVVR
ncbi:MAG: DUF11 domain-containing protein [Chloroflexaceae bacterium]|nr:DUF11 domain-containing protein [Chloroflexaceae bacterium]